MQDNKHTKLWSWLHIWCRITYKSCCDLLTYWTQKNIPIFLIDSWWEILFSHYISILLTNNAAEKTVSHNIYDHELTSQLLLGYYVIIFCYSSCCHCCSCFYCWYIVRVRKIIKQRKTLTKRWTMNNFWNDNKPSDLMFV